MLWSLSWRNVWRNKIRSGVVLLAVAFGLFAGVFSAAVMKGASNQRIRAAIENEISHIQIHHPQFRENMDMEFILPAAEKILPQLDTLKGVRAVSQRLVLNVMVASSETGTGVRVSAVEPEREKRICGISEELIDGAWFEGIKRNPVVIGHELAKKLKVKLRSKVVLTLQDASGTITAGAFRVAGIFQTDNSTFDKANLFVRYSDLQRLSNLPAGSAHEIRMILNENNLTPTVLSEVKSLLPQDEVLAWDEVSPELGYLNSMMDQYMYIFIIIILFALCFGIINTMLMVVLERTRELGMLMAVGMNRQRVFFMIMLETVWLSLSGGLLGILMGIFVTRRLGNTGIDLSMYAEAFRDFGYAPVIYPALDMTILVIITILVLITGVLSAIYPARKALKLNPAESIRQD